MCNEFETKYHTLIKDFSAKNNNEQKVYLNSIKKLKLLFNNPTFSLITHL